MLKRLLAVASLALAAGAASSAAAQDADLAAEGEKVFRRCAACHMIGPMAQNRVGPELTDVMGRQAGTVEGFRYSKAMVEAGEGGLVWDETTLEDYLESPRDHVKGTSMAFAGLRKPEERAAVVAYIVANQGTVAH